MELDGFFSSDFSNVFDLEPKDERKDASSHVKQRLEQLRTLEKRLEQSRLEFCQLAIASRLKTELNTDRVERQSPVGCRITCNRLSNGRLISVALRNRLPAAPLVDWWLLLQISPIEPIIDDCALRQSVSTGGARSYARQLPLLSPGVEVSEEILIANETDLPETDYRPILLRCSLARNFRRETDSVSSDQLISVCVSTVVLTAADEVRDPSKPTFIDRPSIENNHGEEVFDFSFSVSKSLLELLFPESPCVERQFCEWLFPDVESCGWIDEHDAATPTLRSTPLTLGSNILLTCSLQERGKTDDYCVTITLTGIDTRRMLRRLKAAIFVKFKITLHELGKCPTAIVLDMTQLNDAVNELNAEDDDGSDMNAFDRYSDVILPKLPFA